MKILRIPQKYMDKIRITALMRFLLAVCIVAITIVVRPNAVQAVVKVSGWIVILTILYIARARKEERRVTNR